MRKIEIPAAQTPPDRRFLVAVRDTLLILTGRKSNAIDPPAKQSLTFSATPTQAEVEALYDYVQEIRDSHAALLNRMDQ